MLIPLLEADDFGFDALEFAHELGVSFVDFIGFVFSVFQIESLRTILRRHRRPSLCIESLHLRSIPVEYLEDSIEQNAILVVDVRFLH